MNDHQAASRGAAAQQEWTELEAAFSRVREALVEELAQTPVGNDDKVLKLHMSLQNLAAVRIAIRQVIDNGVMAKTAIALSGLNKA